MSVREKFSDFWILFISTHLHPWNRRFHAFGNIFMFLSFFIFALTGNFWVLAIGFLGYLPSWMGHFLFEGNVPVTFMNPYLSALCDLKMIGLMIAGKLDSELIRLFGSARPVPGTPVQVNLDDERAYQEKLRYRISESVPEHPFRAYWDIFVLKHQLSGNIAIHVLAMFYLYGLILTVLITHRWSLLILVPISQIAGLISHVLIEPNHIDFEDAIFSPRAFSCLNRMMFLCLIGGYGRELARVRSELQSFRSKNRVNLSEAPVRL